jgi:hypothetical protein
VSCSTTTPGMRADPHAIKTFIYPCALPPPACDPGGDIFSGGVPCTACALGSKGSVKGVGCCQAGRFSVAEPLNAQRPPRFPPTRVCFDVARLKGATERKPLAAQVSHRDYQYDIASTALLHNTLVVLPTGLGKTLIAAVVMFNFYRWFPNGKILFLAPTRPLVEQQADACHQKLGIPQVKPSMLHVVGAGFRTRCCTERLGWGGRAPAGGLCSDDGRDEEGQRRKAR